MLVCLCPLFYIVGEEENTSMQIIFLHVKMIHKKWSTICFKNQIIQMIWATTFIFYMGYIGSRENWLNTLYIVYIVCKYSKECWPGSDLFANQRHTVKIIHMNSIDRLAKSSTHDHVQNPQMIVMGKASVNVKTKKNRGKIPPGIVTWNEKSSTIKLFYHTCRFSWGICCTLVI